MCHRFALQQCLTGMLVAFFLVAAARAEEKSPQAAEADVSARFAQASFRVAEAELAQALEANKKAPGAINQSEVRRLSLAVERAKVQVELAELQKKAATAEPKALAPKSVQPQLSESELAIRKALDEKSNAQFMDTPLSDVVDFFADKHKILIRLDRKALDDAGIAADTPFSVSLDGISLRSILNLMLNEYDLTHIVQDEVLLITTRDEASQQLSTVVYDVMDLMKVEGDDGYDYDSFIELVTSSIAHTTWDEVGGPGSIAPFDGMIVISQTQAIHAQIAEFLESLRKTRAARPPREASQADLDPQRVSLKVYKVYVPLLPVASPAGPVEPSESGDKPAAAKQALGQFGGGGFGGGKKPSGESVPRAPDPRYLDAMAETITSTIEPESWQAGGGQGVIQVLPANTDGVGTLVVKQTGSVHSQIERLIKEVETAEPSGMGGGGFF